MKTMETKYLERILHEINQFGSSRGRGITRLAFTKEHWEANEYFMQKCREEGMNVRVDTSGNVIARREGLEPQLPVVACGSHLDTVQQGGQYDGTIGVIAGLNLVHNLKEKGIITRHPIEIISFACEESSRFGVSTIGSKAMAGKIDKKLLEDLKDKNGVSLREALAACSIDLNQIPRAARNRSEFKAFLELHIEQGPQLENQKKQIGIVCGIAAPTRLKLRIQGHASHSGTTPMNLRKDALLGAAEIITGLEQAALAEARHGTVATVGECEVNPGAMNVIPDSVLLKIDIRSTKKESRNAVIERLYSIFRSLKEHRGLLVTPEIISDEEPVQLDQEIIHSLTKECKDLHFSNLQMISGAGHDAMNMATLCPTGLIFIPSRNGLSHHQDEYSALPDILRGAVLLEKEILRLAGFNNQGKSGEAHQLDRRKHNESNQTQSIRQQAG